MDFLKKKNCIGKQEEKNFRMKIIKTTTGEAEFVLEETFLSEEKAEAGTDAVSQEVKDLEIKIINTKWKKSDE